MLGALVVTLASLAAACGGGDDGGSSEPTGPKIPKGEQIRLDAPCSLLTDAQVAEVIGSPVTVDATGGGSPLTTDCSYVVGDPAAPTGRLVANVVFPGLTSLGDALEVVESDRANAQIAGPGVIDLDLGEAGFVQQPRSLVEVAATEDFAFSLQWFAPDAPSDGGPITDAVEADLTTLAADIVRRGADAKAT